MRIRWAFREFPGFGLQLGTEVLDNLVRLLFLILFCSCTIFCLLLWWWPNAPSKWVDVAQNTEIQEMPTGFRLQLHNLLSNQQNF
jgi:hypothetical protein